MWRSTRRDRRQVADEQHRQALAGHLIDRAERQAVAVREDQPLVDPGAVGQRRRVQLARRQHHLPVLAVDLVAIVVDRHEVVVGADLLDLAERLEQRLVIPQPHVVERFAVGLDVGARQRRLAGQLALLDAIERERRARRLDVVLDVRRFADLLVRASPRSAGASPRRPRPANSVTRVDRGGRRQVARRLSIVAEATASPAPTTPATVKASAAGMRACTSA